MTDSSSLESQLNRHRAWLVLLARLHLDPRFSENHASDIAQETLVDAIRYRSRIDGLHGQDLENWLRRVLRNKVVDFYRRRQPQIPEADLQRLEGDVYDSFARLDQLIVDSATSPSGCASRQEQHLQLAAALESLSDQHREVIILRDLSGWSLKQIAAHLDGTVGVVAGRLRRARKALCDALEGARP